MIMVCALNKEIAVTYTREKALEGDIMTFGTGACLAGFRPDEIIVVEPHKGASLPLRRRFQEWIGHVVQMRRGPDTKYSVDSLK